mgnify:FL=1|tara:strand:+ start:3973 stop:4143 length:171 start_codon:yes stop_codon:yes gene_type:complete
MSYFTTKYRKYYVRVCLGGNNSLSHQTLGPYTQKDALNMVLTQLKVGICAWMEKID